MPRLTAQDAAARVSRVEEMTRGFEAKADRSGATSDAGSARDEGASESEGDAELDGCAAAESQAPAEPHRQRTARRQELEPRHRSRGARPAPQRAASGARARGAKARGLIEGVTRPPASTRKSTHPRGSLRAVRSAPRWLQALVCAGAIAIAGIAHAQSKPADAQAVAQA